MPRILVGIDGSPACLRALHYAAEVARAKNLSLDLVHVLAPVLLPPTVYEKAIADIERQERAHADRVLTTALADIAPLKVITRRVTTTGNPVETLLSLAADDDVEMIAIGTKGRGAVARVLLGSVADQILHLSPKPVLIVH